MKRISMMAAMLLIAFATLNFFISCENNSQKKELASVVDFKKEHQLNESE